MKSWCSGPDVAVRESSLWNIGYWHLFHVADRLMSSHSAEVKVSKCIDL